MTQNVGYSSNLEIHPEKEKEKRKIYEKRVIKDKLASQVFCQYVLVEDKYYIHDSSFDYATLIRKYMFNVLFSLWLLFF